MLDPDISSLLQLYFYSYNVDGTVTGFVFILLVLIFLMIFFFFFFFTLNFLLLCVCLLLPSIVPPPPSPLLLLVFSSSPFCCLNLAISSRPRGRPSFPWHQIPVDAHGSPAPAAAALQLAARAVPRLVSRGALSPKGIPTRDNGQLTRVNNCFLLASPATKAQTAKGEEEVQI